MNYFILFGLGVLECYNGIGGERYNGFLGEFGGLGLGNDGVGKYVGEKDGIGYVVIGRSLVFWGWGEVGEWEIGNYWKFEIKYIHCSNNGY
jgi:hypothetical protein